MILNEYKCVRSENNLNFEKEKVMKGSLVFKMALLFLWPLYSYSVVMAMEKQPNPDKVGEMYQQRLDEIKQELADQRADEESGELLKRSLRAINKQQLDRTDNILKEHIERAAKNVIEEENMDKKEDEDAHD